MLRLPFQTGAGRRRRNILPWAEGDGCAYKQGEDESPGCSGQGWGRALAFVPGCCQGPGAARGCVGKRGAVRAAATCRGPVAGKRGPRPVRPPQGSLRRVDVGGGGNPGWRGAVEGEAGTERIKKGLNG